MHSGGKELSKMTYEDLLISSKFFYTEGNDDSRLLFPDETKNDIIETAVESRNCARSSRDDFLRACESKYNISSTERQRPQDILDIDVALEAACGDSNFLVSTYGPNLQYFASIFYSCRAG